MYTFIWIFMYKKTISFVGLHNIVLIILLLINHLEIGGARFYYHKYQILIDIY